MNLLKSLIIRLCYLPVIVHYRVLVHEGNVVMVEGEIMHELKASALSARDHYYIAQVHSLSHIMHKNLYII